MISACHQDRRGALMPGVPGVLSMFMGTQMKEVANFIFNGIYSTYSIASW